ncbi:MAG: SH3 domain-containing protein [Syntrophobacteraceae bacterium]
MKKVIRLFVICSCIVTGFIPAADFGSAFAKCIGKDQVNVRSGPSLQSRIILHAPLGYPIKIEKTKGDWVLCRDWENNVGWVHKPLVSDEKTVVVLVNANIRSSAGKQYGVLAKAGKGDIYKMIARKGNWIQLGYFFGDEPLGWIRSDLVFGE